jgi:hypothetical protein
MPYAYQQAYLRTGMCYQTNLVIETRRLGYGDARAPF